MNTEDLTERLDVALDAVLAVRVALGGLVEAPLPDQALDLALGRHAGFQTARRGFVEALLQLRVGGATDEAIVAVEAAVHHLVGQAAEVGWLLAMTARGRLK